MPPFYHISSLFPSLSFRDNSEADRRTLLKECGKTSISIDISIKDEGVWSALRERFTQVGGCRIHQISGRSDVRVTFANITIRQVFYVLEALDSISKEGGIDIYEIVPLLNMGSPAPEQKTSAEGTNGMLAVVRKLHTRYKAAAEKLFDQIEDKQANAFSYEIYHTIFSLSRSGFADEFVLSVLPSLVEYTQVCETYADAITAPEKYIDFKGEPGTRDYQKQMWKKDVLDKIEYIQREYIQALSTLVQCTMHGEKQFVQVPALNCPIFNVPPKLLALYAAMANLVTGAMNDLSERRSFSFLIVPDFRNDIYVRPISTSLGDKEISVRHPHNLLIIYLNEKMFYEPVALLSTLCHEIAHHIGGESRQREARARTFFRSAAMFVVCKTLPLIRDDGAISRELPCVLADAMGKELFSRYEEQPDGSRQFFLADLSEYIGENSAVQRMLQSPMWRTALRDRIYNALKEYDSACDERHHQDLKKSQL